MAHDLHAIDRVAGEDWKSTARLGTGRLVGTSDVSWRRSARRQYGLRGGNLVRDRGREEIGDGWHAGCDSHDVRGRANARGSVASVVTTS